MYPFYEKAVKAGISFTICSHEGPLAGEDYQKSLVAGVAVQHRVGRGEGGEGLAADELRHLSFRAPDVPGASGRQSCSRSSRRRGASTGPPTSRRSRRRFRRQQRRCRREIRHLFRDFPARCRRTARRWPPRSSAPGPRPRRRSRGLGQRFGLVRFAPMADRGLPPARDPAEMRKNNKFAPLGAADGLVKTAILGGNSARALLSAST